MTRVKSVCHLASLLITGKIENLRRNYYRYFIAFINYTNLDRNKSIVDLYQIYQMIFFSIRSFITKVQLDICVCVSSNRNVM